MIRLNNLKPAPGSRHRRKIVGRGEGSGHGGKGSTRGFKGQTARSGDSHMKAGFEGGQIPLIRRIPKRGFNNKTFRTVYQIVNIGDLNAVIEKPAKSRRKACAPWGSSRDAGWSRCLATAIWTRPFK